MQNIVTELRSTAKELAQQPRGLAWGYSLLMTQAADEIERVRKMAIKEALAAWQLEDQ